MRTLERRFLIWKPAGVAPEAGSLLPDTAAATALPGGAWDWGLGAIWTECVRRLEASVCMVCWLFAWAGI